jgi:hypothetical protein
MKNSMCTTITLLLFVFTGYSQTYATTKDGKNVILNNNGTWEYSQVPTQKLSYPETNDKSFNWKDGYDKIVVVKFENFLKDSSIDNKTLNSMIVNSLTTSKYKLKNKVSFVPRVLTIMNDEKSGGYTVTTSYLGKNSYGAESQSKSYFKYDVEGNFIKSF